MIELMNDSIASHSNNSELKFMEIPLIHEIEINK